MARKLHAADIADREKIADAIEFTAHLRKGPFDKITERAKTLAEAGKMAMAIEAANPGRQAIVYAILPNGSSIFVPRDMRETATIAKGENEAMTNLTGTDISKLTAIITGGGFKRANSKDAAKARFLKTAAEAGIEKADAILDMTFEAARAALDARKQKPTKAAEKAKAEAPKVAEKPAGKGWEAIEAARAKIKESKPAKAAKRPVGGKRAAILEAAQRGELPAVPDFSAETHARFRKKLDQVVELVKAGDLKGLKAFEINPVSSSPKAILRYRDLAVIALGKRPADGSTR